MTEIIVIDERVELTLIELCQACNAERALLVTLVDEGVLIVKHGDEPDDWRFPGYSLRRARAAVRLMRDLELNAAGVAVVLDLKEQIEALQVQLDRRN